MTLAAAAAALYAWHVIDAYAGHSVDDAGITYAYARNLAAGHGLRLTPGEAPTEGYSNPLLVVLLALAGLLGGKPDPTSVGLNVGLTAAGVGALGLWIWLRLRGPWRLLGLLPSLLAAYWCGFSFWQAQGLENGLLTGLQVLSLVALLRAPRRRGADWALGLTAGLLAWTRPEGIVYGAVAVGARVLTARHRRWLAAGVFVGLVALLYGSRWLLFHDVVPNTYWAKVQAHDVLGRMLDRTSKGRGYLASFLRHRWWYFALPLWLAAPLGRWGARGHAVTLAALGQLAFAVLFPVYSNGDWMVEYRLLSPMMGPLLVLASLGTVALFGPGEAAPAAGPVGALARPRGGWAVWRARGAAALTCLLSRRLVALASLLLLGGAVWLGFDWTKAQERVADERQIALAAVQERAHGYNELLQRWPWLRRPLVADVDIGGLATDGHFDVLDLVGLSDRALARARRRRPAWGPDYLLNERRPDVLHLQASWTRNLPYHKLSGARGAYRQLAGASLPSPLRGQGVTFVRASLLDPPSPPVHAARRAVAGAALVGVSALATGRGSWLVLVHGRRAPGKKRLARLRWRDGRGTERAVRWHAGLTLARGAVPAGLPVVGFTELPAEVPLPLTLVGAEPALVLHTLPRAPANDETVPGLLRVATLRAGGFQPPTCDPAKVLDPGASPTRQARGAGFVAALCGGLPTALAARWRHRAQEAAEEAAEPDARWDAAAATLRLGLPQWLSTRTLLEEARGAHTPFDEVLDAWVMSELAQVSAPPRQAKPKGDGGVKGRPRAAAVSRRGGDGERNQGEATAGPRVLLGPLRTRPKTAHLTKPDQGEEEARETARRLSHLRMALRLLATGRRWEEVLSYGLGSTEGQRRALRPLLCQAAGQLGLRAEALGLPGGCAGVRPPPPLRLTRQSFETPDDPSLHYDQDGLDPAALSPTTGYRPTAAGGWRVGDHKPTSQGWVVGGHGRRMVNSFSANLGDDLEGSVVWGPIPWAGRSFGALVGGGRKRPGLGVRVEGLIGGTWQTMATVGAPANGELLRAVTAELRGPRASQVRVVIEDHATGDWGHLLVDALTFLQRPAPSAN